MIDVCMIMHVLMWLLHAQFIDKSYDSLDDEKKAFNKFVLNVQDIGAHNRAYEAHKSTFIEGINEFADVVRKNSVI
jgi:hypothetical protein